MIKCKSFENTMTGEWGWSTEPEISISAEQKLVEFVNKNKVKVISIIGKWSRWERETVLFYEGDAKEDGGELK